MRGLRGAHNQPSASLQRLFAMPLWCNGPCMSGQRSSMPPSVTQMSQGHIILVHAVVPRRGLTSRPRRTQSPPRQPAPRRTISPAPPAPPLQIGPDDLKHPHLLPQHSAPLLQCHNLHLKGLRLVSEGRPLRAKGLYSRLLQVHHLLNLIIASLDIPSSARESIKVYKRSTIR